MNVNAAMDKAVRLAQSGRRAEASALLGELLRQADACMAAARHQDALSIYERVCTVIHPDVALLNRMGYCLFQTKNINAAFDTFVQALLLAPRDALAHGNLRAIIQAMSSSADKILAYDRLSRIPSYFDAGPTRVRIEPSGACNLQCRHCPTGRRQPGPRRMVMSREVFDALLLQLQQLPALQSCVLYLGGEPLLNDRLPEMCRRLKQETTAESIILNTNAMLVDRQLAVDLAGAGIDRIQVSIDGRDPGENDSLRQGSDYRRVRDHARLLNEMMPGKIVIANTIVMRPEDMHAAPSPPRFLLEDFPGFPIETSYAMKWPGLDASPDGFSLLSRLGKGFCHAPFSEMSVRANGDLVLCCNDLLSDVILGNVLTDRLLAVWKSPLYDSLRGNILARRVDSLPNLCRQCFNYEETYLVDHGPCRA